MASAMRDFSVLSRANARCPPKVLFIKNQMAFAVYCSDLIFIHARGNLEQSYQRDGPKGLADAYIIKHVRN